MNARRAIGIAESEDEVIEAVLYSARRFVDEGSVSALGESIREAVSTCPSSSSEAEFNDPGWAVRIYW
jgi:hypothetical protein